MVAVEPIPFVPEIEAESLAAFLAGDVWPFHGTSRPTRERALGWIAGGRFSPPGALTFWLRAEGSVAGFVALQDVEDMTPIFDLRVAEAFRGRGIGRRALELVAEQAFRVLGKSRVEGHTRVDNTPMRRLFRTMRWVQEAHHRCAWPDEQGRLHDAVTYALLRQDWESGTSTPIAPFDR